MKKTELSKAKDNAWKAFSKYIRLRDCLRTTNGISFGVCCTCWAELPFKKLQAGHFVSSRRNSILFDEDMVNAQCPRCNTYGHGNLCEYHKFMRRHYTEGEVNEMAGRKFKTKKYTLSDYEYIKAQYIEKYDYLMELYKSGGDLTKALAYRKTLEG